SENRGFTIDGELGARWHLVGGAHQNKLSNDVVFNPVGNYRLNSGEAGARYVTPAENSVTAVARTSRGEYQDRTADPVSLLDTGFDQHEVETRVIWHASAHSLFNGRLGYLERKHDNFSQRDFSGTVGQLDYTWLPTTRTQVLFSLIRDLASYQEATNSYYVLDGFVISPTWQLSEKTTLRARLDLNRRDFRGAVTSVSTMREDRNRVLLFGADWRASRDVLVTASVQRERRTSNLTGLDYSATVANLSAQIAF
ncbi:MAG: outer membrane beta-barrel protein, partial [Bacteroidota bacterium]